MDQIHFLSTGWSDSFLIESNNHYGLIDSSNPNDTSIQSIPDIKRNVTAVINYLNKYKIKTLDFIISTHSHSDHIGGMPMIANAGFATHKTVYYYRPYIGTDEDQQYPEWENLQYYQKAINSMKMKKAQLADVTDQISIS